MRRSSSSSAVALVLAVATTSGIACSDALPTQAAGDDQPASFALSEDSATAFRAALNDVRDRILPALNADAASQPLAQPVVDMTAAITARDLHALRRALARADNAIATLDRDDDARAAIGSELDAVRLIAEHARPLAGGETRRGKR
jgi:hypothetical protein